MIKRKSTNSATNIAQNPPAWRRQLDLFPHQGNLHKPQISSIPGISPKEPHGYRVMIGGQVLGDRAIEQHSHLGKYFPTSQLRVGQGESSLMAQNVKLIFRKNPNHLCSARGSSEWKLDEVIALASQSTHL
jgi:hypothetical protein